MSTADTVVIVDPAAEVAAVEAAGAGRLGSITGKHIGVIDNSKHMACALLVAVEDLLRERYQVAKFTRYRKANPSIPTPPAMLASLVSTCDAVVHGVAD